MNIFTKSSLFPPVSTSFLVKNDSILFVFTNFKKKHSIFKTQCMQSLGTPFEHGRAGMSRFASKRSGRVVKKLILVSNDPKSLNKEIKFISLKLPPRFQIEILNELIHAGECFLAYNVYIEMHSAIQVRLPFILLQSKLSAALEKKGFCDESQQILSLMRPSLTPLDHQKDQIESNPELPENNNDNQHSNFSIQAHAFNSLIESYAGLGLWKKSVTYFHEFERSMAFHEEKSISLAYHSLSKAYCKAKRPLKALELLEEAAEKKVAMDKQTYAMVVDAFSRANNIENMNRVLKYIVDTWKHADIKIYNSFLRLYGKKKQVKSVVGLLKELNYKNVPFDTETYNIVIDIFERRLSETSAGIKLSILDSKLPKIEKMDSFTLDSKNIIHLEMVLNEMKRSFSSMDEDVCDLFDFISTVDLPESICRFGEFDWSLDLHGLKMNAAHFVLNKWMVEVRVMVESMEFAHHPSLNIITGWGKHSEKQGKSRIKANILQWLNESNAPFKEVRTNPGVLVGRFHSVQSWMLENKLKTIG